jgi:hypothetical protein
VEKFVLSSTPCCDILDDELPDDFFEKVLAHPLVNFLYLMISERIDFLMIVA